MDLAQETNIGGTDGMDLAQETNTDGNDGMDLAQETRASLGGSRGKDGEWLSYYTNLSSLLYTMLVYAGQARSGHVSQQN